MRFASVLLCLMTLQACDESRADSVPPRERLVAQQSTLRTRSSAVDRMVVFEGTCDASGAVPLDERRFAVADDENNILRVYDADRGGPPLYAVDVSPKLHFEKKKSEADLEAATRLGNTALWLSSHARSKSGKARPDRSRFFATTLPRSGQPITLVAPAYRDLLDDMSHDARLQSLGLAEAAAKAPKAPGGLNIEGMTAMPDGQLLIGFRNPVPGGRALLVTLLDPREPLAGRPARFGEPILLDLGGLGVRSLSSWHGEYLIAAGPYDSGGFSRLYRWCGPSTTPRKLPGVHFGDLNPEGFFTPEGRDEFMVLSDDGTRPIDGTACKDLRRPERKRFRGAWIRPSREP